ncbi:hypothetical protein [Paraburkholderia sp. J76]|uniref:hypothetical protein n=1 Tax=Paraburkholderia sp. J76 TaxID=2805439 RepID=UPI002ABD1DB6|nr:hypothetical protein [Paraburkholderia sp. J76]
MKTLSTAALLVASAASLTACIVPAPMETAQAPVVVETVGVAVGWYGDRYYDGHRERQRDEWMRRHPNNQNGNAQHDERHRDSGHSDARYSSDHRRDERRRDHYE